MSSLKAFGVIGTGTIGVLAAGLLISNAMGAWTQSIFATGIILFIIFGGAGLLLRSI